MTEGGGVAKGRSGRFANRPYGGGDRVCGYVGTTERAHHSWVEWLKK